MNYKRLLLFLLAAAPFCNVRAQMLTVRSQTIQAPEMGELKFLELGYREERFSLIPPADWRARIDADGAGISFYSAQHQARLSVQFSSNDFSTVSSSADAMREHLAPHLKFATILEEFPSYSGNRQGKGIELRYSLQGITMRCRLAAIPLIRGHVRFILTYEEEEMASVQPLFGAALTSFRQRPTERPAARQELSGIRN